MQYLNNTVRFPLIEMQRGMAQSLARSLFITAEHSDVEHQ